MAKVIETIVIGDDPKGTKQYMLDTDACVLYYIPRGYESEINSKDYPSIDYPCLYVLASDSKFYVGKSTTSFKKRVIDHKQKENKQWWEFAYVFVPTQKNVKVDYLEHLAINDAKANSCIDLEMDNKNNAKEPTCSMAEKIKAHDFYEKLKYLASFAGCDVFRPSPKQDAYIWICEAKDLGLKAWGAYDGKVFTIKAGSIVRKDNVPSYKQSVARNKWLSEHTKPAPNGQRVLLTDWLAKSPSMASGYVLGRPSNGLEDWKDENGVSLSDK